MSSQGSKQSKRFFLLLVLGLIVLVGFTFFFKSANSGSGHAIALETDKEKFSVADRKSSLPPRGGKSTREEKPKATLYQLALKGDADAIFRDLENLDPKERETGDLSLLSDCLSSGQLSRFWALVSNSGLNREQLNTLQSQALWAAARGGEVDFKEAWRFTQDLQKDQPLDGSLLKTLFSNKNLDLRSALALAEQYSSDSSKKAASEGLIDRLLSEKDLSKLDADAIQTLASSSPSYFAATLGNRLLAVPRATQSGEFYATFDLIKNLQSSSSDSVFKFLDQASSACQSEAWDSYVNVISGEAEEDPSRTTYGQKIISNYADTDPKKAFEALENFNPANEDMKADLAKSAIQSWLKSNQAQAIQWWEGNSGSFQGKSIDSMSLEIYYSATASEDSKLAAAALSKIQNPELVAKLSKGSKAQ